MENFEIVYETENARIAISEEFSAVLFAWEGRYLTSEYLEALYVSQKLIDQYQAEHWVSVISADNLTVVNDQLWIEQETIPVSHDKVRRLLFVLPPEIHRRYYDIERQPGLTQILAHSEVRSHHMPRKQDAQNWLHIYTLFAN